jgi:DnaK suppressor protein
MLTQTDSLTTSNDGAVALGNRDRSSADPAPSGHDGRHDSISAALSERLADLRAEHAEVIGEIATDHAAVADAGDDAIDLGTKTFAREQELALALSIRERIGQVERALERLATGGYGQCEGCSGEIPVARLAAFPAATQCVACKQREERR